SYDLLILINSFVNWVSEKLGRPRMSFSKKVKDSVKQAVSYISDFEQTAAELAVDQGYDYVVCGHIHQPQIKTLVTERGPVTYLNSGDWVENLTALEYHQGHWSIYAFQESDFAAVEEPEAEEKQKVVRIPQASPQTV
ncbi:MAG: UDP-2,3-diacylglucosamine diphosphatase, partial [Bacteroidetes bacterium]